MIRQYWVEILCSAFILLMPTFLYVMVKTSKEAPGWQSSVPLYEFPEPELVGTYWLGSWRCLRIAQYESMNDAIGSMWQTRQYQRHGPFGKPDPDTNPDRLFTVEDLLVRPPFYPMLVGVLMPAPLSSPISYITRLIHYYFCELIWFWSSLTLGAFVWWMNLATYPLKESKGGWILGTFGGLMMLPFAGMFLIYAYLVVKL